MNVSDKLFEFGQDHRIVGAIAAGLVVTAFTVIGTFCGRAAGDLIGGALVGKIDEPTDTSNDDGIEAEVVSVE